MLTPSHPPSGRSGLRRLLAPLQVVYALYAGLVFVLLAVLTLLVLLGIPSLGARRALVRAAARTFFALAGLRVTIRGRHLLPATACVVVANHASYLDGVLLSAVLPARFSFVIKREMEAVPLAGLLLRRIGAQFVERANRQRGAGDARRVMRAASSGQSLAFFPEGTFSPEPGLLRFHAGAFVTAARAGFPVVPIVIRGTRRAMPPDGSLPLPGRLRVEFLPAIPCDGHAPEHAAKHLRERARAAILEKVPEPDFAS
ncbi:MAG: lysophospholipid acyltransferase family protein [Steroidobacteraceae bacterium]